MKKILALVVVIIAGVAAFLWWRSSSNAEKAKASAPVPAKVERGGVRQTVASTGKVVSNLDVEIKCKASGAVVKLPFDVSQTVRRGDLLLEVDPKDE